MRACACRAILHAPAARHRGDAKKKTYSLLGMMLVFHLVLVFMFKVQFFHYA